MRRGGLHQGRRNWKIHLGHQEYGAPHTEGVAFMLTSEARKAMISWKPVVSIDGDWDESIKVSINKARVFESKEKRILGILSSRWH